MLQISRSFLNLKPTQTPPRNCTKTAAYTVRAKLQNRSTPTRVDWDIVPQPTLGSLPSATELLYTPLRLKCGNEKVTLRHTRSQINELSWI